MPTNYQVKVIFNSYEFIGVQYENGSNLPDNKNTIIEGNRADGCILIPGGKRPLTITIRGIMLGADYKAITTLMNTMKSAMVTTVGTLKLQHVYGTTVIDWTYTVRRTGEVNFPENLRTNSQEYEVNFLVLGY